MSSGILNPFVAMVIGRSPYVAVLIVALYFWLVHPLRWTRGMKLFGIGIISELLLSLLTPLISTFLSWRLNSGGGATIDPSIQILVQMMIFSVMAAIPLVFLLLGGFELARERNDDEMERDAVNR